MKKITLPLLLIVAFSFISQKENDFTKIERFQYEQFIKNHAFNLRNHIPEREMKKMAKPDRPDLAYEQNFLATLDPALGYPPAKRLIPVYNQVQAANSPMLLAPGGTSSPWVERGPNNVGGRTRTIMYDPNDSTQKKVWAGGVSGGLWYNNDITSETSSWYAVNDFWDNLSVTGIVYDPNDSSTFYVSTGEGWSNRAIRGAGIWKSTNGGVSWSQITSTSSFYFINDIVVRDESGTSVIYAAVHTAYYGGTMHNSNDHGLQRSTNGGSTWTQVLPNIPGQNIHYGVADIELSKNNDLWVGTIASPFSGTDRGGGRVLKSINGTTWTVEYTESLTNAGTGRVELACAPSNNNYVYAIFEDNRRVKVIKKTTNGGTSWTTVNQPNDIDPSISSTDFSRRHAWYDLILAVDPNNANTVLAGAINLYRSTNGGTSWSQMSVWQWGGLWNYQYVHADQHAIVFKPGSSSQVLFGTDGGVFYTDSISYAGINKTVIKERIKNYNVTQFYSCAIDPSAGSNNFLAGTQDNGTQQFSLAGVNSTFMATGGDGGYCFYDKNDSNIVITAYIANNYFISTNGGTTFGWLFNDMTTGLFINPTEYDENLNILYSARTNNSILRISSIGNLNTADTLIISNLGTFATHLKVSSFTTSSTTLFIGTATGKVFKLTNANTASPMVTDITGSNLPTGSISCIELGSSESELIVTFFNYGVTSVWYSSNGGTTWTSKEGNLPDMPIRWVLQNPNDSNEVILATEVGVWSTTNFNSTTPSWAPSNSGLANVRVDMLKRRDSDNEVIAATHGRGLFSSDGFKINTAPTADFTSNLTIACNAQTIILQDLSSGSPTSWTWNITPNTFTFKNGTTVNSQNPEVNFTTNGYYSISLVATNINGSDSIYKQDFILVGGAILPFLETFESPASVKNWKVVNLDNGITWKVYTVGGSSPGTHAMGIDNWTYSASNITSQKDFLNTPPLNLTGYSHVTLTFDYAYQIGGPGYEDSLSIAVTSNCGSPWTVIAHFKETGGNNYVTRSASGTAFIPAVTTDWCGSSGYAGCITLSLDAFVGHDNVRVSFNNLSGYGNNLFLDNISVTGVLNNPPVANFTANDTVPCVGDTVTFTDLSSNNPTSWAWSFSPLTYTFVNGTTANSQHPQVAFNAMSNYSVTLIATDSDGSDTLTKTNYIQVNPGTPAAVAITGADTLCASTTTIYTATPTNGGATPVFKWKRNGNNLGTNSPTLSTNVLANGDKIWVEMTSSVQCVLTPTVFSDTISVTVNPSVTPAISVLATADTICALTSVTFTATPINEGLSPVYQWKLNSQNVGGNSTVYSNANLQNGDSVWVVLTSSESCVTANAVSSSVKTISVNPIVTPAVSVSVSADTICSGGTVTYTANPTNEGSNPIYQWYKNGSLQLVSGAVFTSSSMANGDSIYVTLTSSILCKTASSVSSQTIKTTVLNTITPTISVSATSLIICQGASVTFTATFTNGGNNPFLQWRINGALNGITGNTFTSTALQSADEVSCRITSNALCAPSTPVISNAETMLVYSVPTVSLGTMSDVCDNAAPFTLSNGIPAGGTYSGSGVSNGVFNPATAGLGNRTIKYVYANSNGCKDSATTVIKVISAPPKPVVNVSVLDLSTTASTSFNMQWYFNGSPINGATSNKYTVQFNGYYNLELTHPITACTSWSDTIYFNNISVEELEKYYGLEIYPNPTDGILNIDFKKISNTETTIAVFNGFGQKVFYKTYPPKSVLKEKIDLSNYAKGVYFIHVSVGERKITKRVVLQ